ncbi:hypothetical protein Tco_1446181 [Tanacetum coccineum]
MEEYIELEAERARRHGRAFNWETATYDSEKDIDKVNLPRSDVIIKQLGDGIDANVDTESDEFHKDFETNHEIYHESYNMEEIHNNQSRDSNAFSQRDAINFY